MSSSGAGEGSGPDAARIQPEEPPDFELDRLLGDQELLTRLQLEKFVGLTWDRVAQEFARYGLSVWRGWMRTGQAYVEASKVAPGSLSSPAVPIPPDEMESLLNEVVARALGAFRDNVLRKNKWDPRRGASLKTFFIGQCKFHFRDVYRQFERERRRHAQEDLVDEFDPEDSLFTFPSADGRLIDEEARQAVLESLSTEQARRILELKDLGYTHDEIAEHLSLDDSRVVTNALHYQRRRLSNP